MYKKSIFLIFICAFLFISSVDAKTIIWVAMNWDANADGVNDSQEWVDKLRAEGYTVDFRAGNWEALTAAQVLELNAADLVIISGTIQSGTYATDATEISRWNSVTAPILNCCPYVIRSTRWNWVNNGDAELPNNNGDQGSPLLQAVTPGHPIFWGVPLDANKQVKVVDPALGSGNASFLNTTNVGNGTLIAKTVGNEWFWISEWQKGVEFYNGSAIFAANRRMYFSIGYHENTTTAYAARGYNLTPDGWNLYLNTVKYMLGELVDPKKASNPSPADGEPEALITSVLSWKSGTLANTHNVYFGTDFNDVNEATIASHAGVTLTQALDVNNLNPGTLDFGATYYWRVDEVNAPSSPGSYRGPVWTFTVEPYAYKLPKESITVAVRNNAAKNDPNNTINEVGLDPNHIDQHSNSSGMWLSGTVSAADPAWIRYDFDRLYKIHEMLVWNYNSKLLLNSGIRQVLVEYSADGLSWTPITSVTEFAKGSGNMGYVYNTVVPFNDVAIKSVRITALSNWGTSYKNGGLSEIRFTYIPTRARIPSPEMDKADVAIDSALSWRPGREAVTHDVYISTNEQLIINGTAPAHTVSVNTYLPLLDLGRVYYWSVTEVNNAETPKRWESDIWSFSTIEYASIDDFEDYNGTDGYYIWQTWDDGASNPSNGGSQIGYINNPFIESVIAQHGKQSAPVYYDNSTSSNVSEVSRTFATALNWQVNGADTLRLYYRGNAITFAEPSPGVIAMSAEGTDIAGTSDQFRYAYKTLTGNGSITARVDSIQNTNAWAKAGIMIRGTLDPNSMHVATVLGANGTAELESRITKGGTTATSDVTGQGFPCWVRITRSGNTFTAQRSKDGVNWYSFGTDPNTPSTVTIAMTNPVYIGIAVTSHAADVLAAATLSNVSTTGTVSAGAWTVAAIGDTDQAQGSNTIDALYVGIEDSTGKSAKVYAPANAVGSGSWIGWLVPYSQFTGVNMTKVKKLSIGVGNSTSPAKGKGLILIDNIGYGHTLVK